MKRLYYISKDLRDLKAVEEELREKGVMVPQLHVLSENDAEVEKHHLHAIESVLKKDVVRSTQKGALVGVVGAAILLLLVYFMNWHLSAAGWMPFGFLAVIILGFCTWEGGLIGIQVPNYQFKRFQKLLGKGYHVFFVDISQDQQELVKRIIGAHPRLKLAGEGDATPEWVVKGQDKFSQFMKSMP